VENGESFLEAAKREAEEETGFSFPHIPQYLGMEYHFQGRFGAVVERAFALWIYGETTPTPVLDPKEHTDFQWCSPDEALALLLFPTNKEALKRATRPLPPLLLSKQGSWFQEGEEVSHGRTAELLHQYLVKTDSGYFVRIGAEEAEVILEDVPRFVEAFDIASGELRLRGGEKESLRPETLSTTKENILYCTLQNGWQAKFLSAAYYTIAKEIEESVSGEFVLHFRGRRYGIAVSR
jgi:ADP-ribose pyrophosphatase YjhB (NUDIX family)